MNKLTEEAEKYAEEAMLFIDPRKPESLGLVGSLRWHLKIAFEDGAMWMQSQSDNGETNQKRRD